MQCLMQPQRSPESDGCRTKMKQKYTMSPDDPLGDAATHLALALALPLPLPLPLGLQQLWQCVGLHQAGDDQGLGIKRSGDAGVTISIAAEGLAPNSMTGLPWSQVLVTGAPSSSSCSCLSRARARSATGPPSAQGWLCITMVYRNSSSSLFDFPQKCFSHER